MLDDSVGFRVLLLRLPDGCIISWCSRLSLPVFLISFFVVRYDDEELYQDAFLIQKGKKETMMRRSLAWCSLILLNFVGGGRNRLRG